MLLKRFSIAEKIACIAAAGLLGGVILSWPLWSELSRRSFPVLPLFGDATLDRGPDWGVLMQPYLAVALIVFTGISPHKKRFPVLLVLWLLWLCLLDVNRLQPWVWFYLLVFGIVICREKTNEKQSITALSWLLAGIYFWSGFNKLTPYFAENNFAWFCEAFSFTRPFSKFPSLGYGIAFFEMAFAAGLIWERTRLYFRWIVIGFHSVIIIFLLKLNWNHVVIPWNAAMAGMVWVLHPNVAPSPSEEKPGMKWDILLSGFSWVAPIFCFLHLWPYALSWQLYTNTQPEATFYSEGEAVKLSCTTDFSESHLQKMWQKHAFAGGSKLLLDDWANDALRVPMFASERTFRQTGRYLCRCLAEPDSAGLYILTVNRWDRSAEKMEKIPCSELMMNDE